MVLLGGFTVDVVLLLGGHDREEMPPTHAAVLLSRLPALPLGKVTIAEALKLLPARLTRLQVWAGQRHKEWRRRGTVSLWCYWCWEDFVWITELTLNLSDTSLLRNRASKDTSSIRRRHTCLHSNKGSPGRSLQLREDDERHFTYIYTHHSVSQTFKWSLFRRNYVEKANKLFHHSYLSHLTSLTVLYDGSRCSNDGRSCWSTFFFMEPESTVHLFWYCHVVFIVCLLESNDTFLLNKKMTNL